MVKEHSIMEVKDIVLLENLIDRYGTDAVLNEMKFTNKQIAWLIGAGLLTATGVNTLKSCLNDSPKTNIEVTANKYNVPDSVYQKILAKTDALKREIDRIQKLHGRTINDIKFDPELMVYLCYKYDFDLPLMFIQAQHETGLGLNGIGPKCNSLFSIGAYDDNPAREKFDSQNSSMIPYIRTVKGKYLLDGKRSVDDLLKKGGFVNGVGNRYSSDKQYEQKLKSSRDSLIRRYPELASGF
jgi:hypothetical protein